jgi:DNA polymerase elongation subunit (family B)
MKATFIDCYVQQDSIVLWLKDGKKNIRVVDRFVPNLYIGGTNLKDLRRRLLKRKIKSFFEKKKSFLNGREIFVLKVPIFRLSRYRYVCRLIEKIENYAVELYNADMKIEELYMFEKDLFPTAEIEYEEENGRLKNIKNIDDVGQVKYKIPEFRFASLKVKTKESLSKRFDSDIVSINYNGKEFSGENMLLGFKRAFLEHDPDVIWSENGNLEIPYLKEAFQKRGIEFNFNRFDEDDIKREKGESYFTYSQIVYRTASIFLKGRLHFDTKSFFADDTGFYGIIDGARVCRQRIQRVEMRSAGAAVTNLLLYEAYRRNFLLPYKVGMYERFKTLGDLYEADRGSIIFEPRVGFHTDVAELDFVSLYPQIMWKRNLSPETLYCKCCVENKVPGLNYNYCKKKRGVVSIVAENLVNRRVALKELGTPEAKERADYLKWLLVTMFGYQAFKNRKIGIIESHESIQAYARETIMKSVRIAESLGWEVVHGIVDSIYVKKKGYSEKDVELLKEEIERATGYKVALEGNYNWIVFLPSVVNVAQPVSNSFYGIFENGDVKCRGIEVRRKDVPMIVKNMQSEMIEALADSKNEEEFREKFRRVFKILKNYIESLDHITAEELTIIRRISKLDYKNEIAQKVIVDQMTDEGWDMQPGQKITYIIRDVKNKNPKKRYILPEDFKGKFDRGKYIDLMVRATFNILQPFDVGIEELVERLKGSRQLKLEKFIVKGIPIKKSLISSMGIFEE